MFNAHITFCCLQTKDFPLFSISITVIENNKVTKAQRFVGKERIYRYFKETDVSRDFCSSSGNQAIIYCPRGKKWVLNEVPHESCTRFSR